MFYMLLYISLLSYLVHNIQLQNWLIALVDRHWSELSDFALSQVHLEHYPFSEKYFNY